MSKARLIAIHLPQFHPFKENDEWWGEGFTEWTNVAKARPRFIGHYQPHIPADLGFYDLRLEESRIAQAQLASAYGIYGFCYYHYWFNGHQLMQRPLEEILTTGKPDFPFMLCWANENWTRAWDGGEKDTLIEQKYSDDDDREHIRFLCQHYFKDKRYIRVDNRPVFCIYRSTLFPNIERSISTMRDEARKYGEELYICRFESHGYYGADYLRPGFDAAVDFQPHMGANTFISTLKALFNAAWYKKFHQQFFTIVDDYDSYAKSQIKVQVDYKRYPCVTPMWDNSPRRVGRPFYALKNSTPQKYEHWLSETIRQFTPFSPSENFVFINAWNEWAEGNHLEPDLKWGRGYLEATKRASDIS